MVICCGVFFPQRKMICASCLELFCLLKYRSEIKLPQKAQKIYCFSQIWPISTYKLGKSFGSFIPQKLHI
jgi:hypothetical protein